jgi:hypothetical protein
MHKLIAALAVVSTLGFAGSAFAGAVQLSDSQMDTVTAGFHRTTSSGFASTAGAAGGNTGSGVVTAGYAHASGDTGVGVAGVLAIGVGSHSFAAGGVTVAASSSSTSSH